MTDADDIAARAREIATRAEHIAADVTDSQELREELDRLDAELARLDEERRRLDEELRDRAEATSSEGQERDARGDSERPAWTETIVDLVSDVTERISALGSGAWPWRSSETVERSIALDGATAVVIENRAGAVKVESGDADTVTVQADLFAPSTHLIDEMSVTAEHEGHEIVIRSTWPDQRRGRRARLTVTVPTGLAVRADTLGGSVTVKDTHGSAAASTKGGSITITGTNGEADARTLGGSVRIADHIGVVRAKTSGGSLHLGGHLTGSVDATTAGGSVHVEGVDRAAVNASTSGGSIRVIGRLVGASRIRTAGGSVTLSIPSDSQVEIDGRGTSASSDFPELDVHRGRVTGRLGDGSDGSIELRTSGGSVTVSKT